LFEVRISQNTAASGGSPRLPLMSEKTVKNADPVGSLFELLLLLEIDPEHRKNDDRMQEDRQGQRPLVEPGKDIAAAYICTLFKHDTHIRSFFLLW
jgi:hypothetical protein